jgi:hypothetical protein
VSSEANRLRRASSLPLLSLLTLAPKIAFVPPAANAVIVNNYSSMTYGGVIQTT